MGNTWFSRRGWISVLLVALLMGSGTALRAGHAQTAPDESVLDDALVRFQAKKGLQHLYNMEFEQADVLFSQIDRRYPNHPIGSFLKALNVWWQILINLQDTSHDDAFFAALNETIERSNRLLERDEDHFDAMFFKGAALGFRGRQHSNRGRWLKAANDGKRAMDYVLEVAERYPENDDYAFGKGIYDYYAWRVPKKYPFARPFMVFFPDGDRERGLRALKRTAENGFYIQAEAAYFLLQIYYRFEKDFEKSEKYATWLREQYPKNSFFHTYAGRMYARFGRWKQARTLFEEVWARYQQGQTGYVEATARQALYFIARHDLINDEPRQALRRLKKLEQLGQQAEDDTYFEVWGQLRMGMAYDALERRALALKHYQRVLNMEEWGDSRKRAERYIENPYQG